MRQGRLDDRIGPTTDRAGTGRNTPTGFAGRIDSLDIEWMGKRTREVGGPFWWVAGSISGFLAVTAGAFGAHILGPRLGEKALVTYETAVRYQAMHALALLLVGLGSIGSRAEKRLAVAGGGFLLGTFLFSGSLYGLALTGWRGFGPITPLGGLGFLIGWAALALVGIEMGRPEPTDPDRELGARE